MREAAGPGPWCSSGVPVMFTSTLEGAHSLRKWNWTFFIMQCLCLWCLGALWLSPSKLYSGPVKQAETLKHLIWRLMIRPSWEPIFSHMRISLASPPCLSQEGFLCSQYLNENDSYWLWATLSSRASGCSLLGSGKCCQPRTSMENPPHTRGSIRANDKSLLMEKHGQ